MNTTILQGAYEPTSGISHDPANKTSRFPKTKTRILKAWYIAHSNHPYPNDYEKEMLQEQTGLSIRQISHWFVNARRRGNVPLPQSSSVSMTVPSASTIRQSTSDLESWEAMSPLDRWRHSPPDQEAAPLNAIANAVRRTKSVRSDPGCIYGNSFASSVSSSETFESASIAHSSGSSSSNGSFSSLRSNKYRRRRRQPAGTPSLRKQREDRKFQCTFCTDAFKSKYDWTRHEATLHLVLEKWTCMAYGPLYSDNGHPCCIFCDATNPSEVHLQSHGYTECKDKPLGARTFYRKDHLRQHLRSVHDIDKILPSMSCWKTKIEQISSRCGFCDERFTIWSERNDHLADHFRAGARMKDWKGCRGLGPVEALLVEHAMPPYLIGVETEGLEPFSATKAAKTGGPNNTRLPAPTLFQTVAVGLSKYVSSAKEQGTELTDDMLRKEARLILYGDDDPWNQTPADNNQWLALFKISHGMESNSEVTCNLPHPQSAKCDHDLGLFKFNRDNPPAAKQHSSNADFFPFYDDWLQTPPVKGTVISNPSIPLVQQTPDCFPGLDDLDNLLGPNHCNTVVPGLETPALSDQSINHYPEHGRTVVDENALQTYNAEPSIGTVDLLGPSLEEMFFPFDLDILAEGLAS